MKSLGWLARPPIPMLCFWSCAAVILYLSLSASQELPSTGWDKANHLLAFAVLGSLGLLSWPRRAWRLLPALVAYGGVIELLQTYTPSRQGDWVDLAADAAGLVLGWLLVRRRANRVPLE